MHNLLEMTNATKAGIIALINAVFPLLAAFGFELSGDQVGAINVFINTALGLWVALTYKDSHKRLPDDTVAVVTADGADEPFFVEADYDEEGNFKNE